MHYVSIIVPKKAKKYKADVFLQLLPKNVRGQIVTLAEYQNRPEGSTNDDICVFIGKDPGSLGDGEVLFPKPGESLSYILWTAVFDLRVETCIKISKIGRSVLIMCHEDMMPYSVAQDVLGKMKSVFSSFGLNVSPSSKSGWIELTHSAFDVPTFTFEAITGIVNKIRGKDASIDIKQVAKDAYQTTIRLEYWYEYAACIFIRDYLKDFLSDDREVFNDDTIVNGDIQTDVKKK